MKKTGFLFSLLLLLASCSQDQLNPSSSELVDTAVRVSLHTSPMKVSSTSTRSTTLPADVAVFENRIEHLWGFQFAHTADGSGQLLKKVDLPVANTNDIEFVLKGTSAGIKSKLYFVANMGSAVFPDAGGMTEAEFKVKMSAEIATEGGFLLQNNVNSSGVKNQCIPMFGECKEAVTVYGGGSMDKLDINLVRMLARVDVIYSVPATFTNFSLQGIRVCNVPKKMRFFGATDAGYVPTYLTSSNVPELVPTINNSNELQDTDFEATVNTKPEPTTLIYYLPENHRGVGSNTATIDEKLKVGIANATYFEFTGLTTGTTSDVLTYKFYPGKDNFNDYNLDRNTYYTLTAELTGGALSDPRISALVKSNCYMVAINGESVSIPISRANEGNPAKPITSLTNPNCTASVLWQTSDSKPYLTLGKTNCNSGFFTVSVPSGVPPGNAVVVIRRNDAQGLPDPTGQILWSWHIWVTDPADVIATQTLNGIPFMDRNLGATTKVLPNTSLWTASGKIPDVGSFGLLYQWGRKDPFPNVSAANVKPDNTAASGTVVLADMPIYHDGAGNRISITDINVPGPTFALTTTITDGLAYSIANPSTFIKGAGTNNSDWYSYTSGVKNDGLWGGAKTVYDPCPVGWRVPLNGSWFGLDKKNGGTTSTALWDDFIDFTWSGGVGSKFIGRTTGGGAYPASGYRNDSSGAFNNVGTSGYCWSGSVTGTLGDGLSFTSPNVNPSNRTSRASGYGVRCVREQ